MRNLVPLTLVPFIAVFAAGCGDNSPLRPTPPAQPPSTLESPSPPAPAPVIVPDAVLVGAGDVGLCGVPEVEATARLLESVPGTVMALGDLAYPSGSSHDYAACYDPTWGRVKARTRPAPGNHDYETQQAAPYFSYFGDNAGPSGLGYYSYRAGAWLVLSLNSNIPASADSPQAMWVRETLASNPSSCTLAYWHHPMLSFSTGSGASAAVEPLWVCRERGRHPERPLTQLPALAAPGSGRRPR